ncbi:MAG: protoporphyrinogen oxidase [Actinomycetales bacterium]
MTGPTPPSALSGPTVVVVGAGISGLTAAYELLSRRPGLRVLVLDGAEQVGGKLTLVEVAGVTLDAGAEAFLARRPEALDLARAVGLGDDLETPHTATAGVWSRGRLQPLPSGTLMGVPAWSREAIGVLTAQEAARIDREVAEPAPPMTDDVDVASYVSSRVGPAVVDRLVEPLLGGVYAGHADRLSLQATLPVAWEAARTGASLVAAARAQRSAAPRRGREGAAAPVFAGIRGGVGRLTAAVADAVVRAGGDIRTRVTVRGVERAAGRWLLTTGSRADEAHLTADALVLAVPARPASRLLAGAVPAAAAELAAVEAASIALVVAVLPGAAETVAGGGSGFLVPPVDGRLVKAVTYSSAKWDWLSRAAGPDLVVRLSVGRQGEEATLQRTDAELTSAALDELAEAMRADLPQPAGTRVVRWGGGLPQYAVGHVDRMARVRAAVAGQPGLAVCGAYLDGLGVPACIATARTAAERVLADLPEGAGTPGVRGGRTMDP